MNLLQGFLVLGVVTAISSATLSSNQEIGESKTNAPEPADSNTKEAYLGFPNVKDLWKNFRTWLQQFVKEIWSVITTGSPSSGNIEKAKTDDTSKPQGGQANIEPSLQKSG
ncbi:hypothetical protein FKM82_007282 [Ascaphus truei]